MAASKYEELANNILELIGGADNASSFTHCVTRLRLNIIEKSGVDLNKIKKLQGVKGAQWSGDQLQIIIGGGVDEAYQLVCDKTGLGDSSSQNGAPKKRKLNPGIIIDIMAASISPVVTLLIGTGMIKIIMLLGTIAGLFAEGDSTYAVLSFVSDSAFYFLPVLVGFAAANRFQMNPYMGAFFGAMLLHPDFIAMVGSGEPITLLGLPIYATSYSSSIFPVILTVLAASYVEKFLKKHSPEILRSILVPFLTILVMAPVSLCVLSPLGDVIGVYFANAVIWLYDTLGFLGVALFAGLHPLLVMTGMQHGMSTYLVSSLTNPGYEALASPATFIDNINIGIAALAVSIKTKINRVRLNAAPSALTAVVGGVTEPALFGIVLQYRSALVSTMIGSFIGGAIAGLARCVCYSFAGSYGVLGLVTFIGEKGMPNFIWMLVAVAAGAVVTFILTIIFYKDDPEELAEESVEELKKDSAETKVNNDKADNKIYSPITGEVKNLKECTDETFASGTLGNGVMIEPTENKVYSPCDGVVASVFETLHAIGIVADNGAELLIHVGMDTVTLKGEGFKVHVKDGDRLKKGQLILEFDIEFIKSKGLLVTTPFIVANSHDFPEMIENLGTKVHGEEIIAL